MSGASLFQRRCGNQLRRIDGSKGQDGAPVQCRETNGGCDCAEHAARNGRFPNKNISQF
jgi:hypothetical protein